MAIQLPPDTTEAEIIQVLQDIWAEHLPRSDASFLTHLTAEDARLLLDIICTSDVTQQNILRAKIEEDLHKGHATIQVLLNHFALLKNQYSEKIDIELENADEDELLSQLN